MSYEIEYFTENDGGQPVSLWLNSLDNKTNANLIDKVVRLQQNGLILLKTNMLQTILGYGQNFYEIVYGDYRIAVFHDTDIETFILLHAFRKTRQREEHEIKVAYSKIQIYLERKRKQNG